jgi:hypothetical protein
VHHPKYRAGRFSAEKYRRECLIKNLSEWWQQPTTPWIIGVALIVVATLVLRRRAEVQPTTEATLCCVTIATPVLLWFVVVNNHTQIHSWLVYRSLALAFGGLCAIVVTRTSLSWRGRPPLMNQVGVDGMVVASDGVERLHA